MKREVLRGGITGGVRREATKFRTHRGSHACSIGGTYRSLDIEAEEINGRRRTHVIQNIHQRGSDVLGGLPLALGILRPFRLVVQANNPAHGIFPRPGSLSRRSRELYLQAQDGKEGRVNERESQRELKSPYER